jgi:N-acetyl-alpha-D-muramate 1-phosphate uridylyltransferase
MLFAAGLGTRLRPLTEHTPKPLIRVGGTALLDHTLARFEASGVERIVVNTHHHAAQLARHLAARTSPSELVVSHEPRLLETGGGIVQALPWLGYAPFFSANSDAFWIDGATPALVRLAQAFDAARMDALLLLIDPARAVGYSGAGDFELGAEGQLSRAGKRLIFSGLQLLHPRLFAPYLGPATPAAPAVDPRPFSLREVYAAAELPDGTLSRMFGLVHDADWVHVGAPAELEAAEAYLAARAGALPQGGGVQ